MHQLRQNETLALTDKSTSINLSQLNITIINGLIASAINWI